MITDTGVELNIHAFDGTDTTNEISVDVQVSYTVYIIYYVESHTYVS